MEIQLKQFFTKRLGGLDAKYREEKDGTRICIYGIQLSDSEGDVAWLHPDCSLSEAISDYDNHAPDTRFQSVHCFFVERNDLCCGDNNIPKWRYDDLPTEQLKMKLEREPIDIKEYLALTNYGIF